MLPRLFDVGVGPGVVVDVVSVTDVGRAPGWPEVPLSRSAASGGSDIPKSIRSS